MGQFKLPHPDVRQCRTPPSSSILQGGFVAKDVIFGHEAHDFFRVLVAEGVYEGVGG
jgi:hypothetical protein